MFRLETPPASDAETARRVQLLTSVLRTMVAMGLIGLVTSLLDTANDVQVTLVFYALIFLVIFWISRAVRRGRVTLVAWAMSLFFWVVIAFVTLFFGGLKGPNAACFGVCVLMVGGVVGGRAAMVIAVGTSAWCALVAMLEVNDALPRQLGPYSPINAWTAVTVSLVLMSVLLRNSLESLRAMHVKAEASALERDEALRRSIQGQKMELVGNLVSSVAHDFNNLLLVIASASEAAQQDLGADRARVGGLFDDLDDATSRAVLLTRQLLSFARTKPSEPTRVDLGEQVNAFALMLPRLMGPGIAVEVAVEPGAVVCASRVGLDQILLNLAVNARDAMPKGGRLAIRVRVEDRAVRLQVTDSGVGMDAATRARIFTPFFTTKATGTGLGLATVCDKVMQAGGAITVESEPGHGSTFEITFERATDAPAPRAPAPNVTRAPVATGATRLLLVDDDPSVRRALSRVLEQAGFDVVEASHGGEALELLAQADDVVCVVSDITMPVLDGEELAARLAASNPGLPVVLMSGNQTALASALAQPRRTFVEKPVDRTQLLRAIEQVRRP